MLNLFKIFVLCIIFFAGRNLFAQPIDTQVSNPEFKKMDINNLSGHNFEELV